MCRAWTILVAAVALLVVGTGAGTGPGSSPAARILELKGKATLVEGENFDRPAVVFGTIYADNRLVVAKDSQVTLVFRSDGHVERVVVPGTFQVTPSGCRPKTGVEEVAMPDESRATIGRISRGSRGIVRGGVVVARAPAPPQDASPQEGEVPVMAEPAKIRPIAGSTVLDAKPTFSWPVVPKAKKYTLALYFLGNQVWSAESETPRLQYSGETPLESGVMYSWEVTADAGGKAAVVCEGAFHTASERQRAEAAALEKMLAKPEPLYLAVGALWYGQNDMVAEAIAVNEQLVKLTPNSVIYRELTDLYFRADCERDALAADAKAVELERKAESERK